LFPRAERAQAALGTTPRASVRHSDNTPPANFFSLGNGDVSYSTAVGEAFAFLGLGGKPSRHLLLHVFQVIAAAKQGPVVLSPFFVAFREDVSGARHSLRWHSRVASGRRSGMNAALVGGGSAVL
jgi:hypothetical protein